MKLGLNNYKIVEAIHNINKVLQKLNGEETREFGNLYPDEYIMLSDAVENEFKNPCTKEGEAHQRWIDSKVADGWKFGKEKCTVRKTHPQLIPFEELDPINIAKDSLFMLSCKLAKIVYEQK